mgnify:CR=1 FL=1
MKREVQGERRLMYTAAYCIAERCLLPCLFSPSFRKVSVVAFSTLWAAGSARGEEEELQGGGVGFLFVGGLPACRGGGLILFLFFINFFSVMIYCNMI